MNVANSEELGEISGKYFQLMKETKSSEESYDVNKARALWDLSCAWSQLN